MTDSQTIPDDMAARVARLINEAEDMRQQAADDLKQIYADLREELRGLGWDGKHVSAEVAALKGAIGEMRLDEKAKEKREEKGERVDDYVSLLTRARAREGNSYAAARRADSGLNIVTKHTEITASPETATECAAPEKDAAADERSVEADGGAALVRTLSDQLREGGNNAQQVPQHVVSDRRHHSQGDKNTEKPQAAEQAGGEHEVAIGSAMRAGLADPTSNTGEGAASALPATDEFLEDVPPMPMKRLRYAHCFPELTKAEYGRLEFSIIGIGVSKPIIRMGDVIVDGWARYNICRTLGISYPIQNYSGNDVLLDVIEWQRAARNFTPAQEKKIAADLAKEIPHRADDIMAAFGLADEAMEAAE